MSDHDGEGSKHPRLLELEGMVRDVLIDGVFAGSGLGHRFLPLRPGLPQVPS